MPAYPKTHQARRAKPLTVAEFKATTESEAGFQQTCEEYLAVHQIAFIRFPDAAYKAIFANPAIKPYLKALCSRFMKGMPDITILNTDGRFLCIELKTAKGKQSQGQKNFQSKVRNHYIIVRSFEEFEKRVTDFINERGTK